MQYEKILRLSGLDVWKKLFEEMLSSGQEEDKVTCRNFRARHLGSIILEAQEKGVLSKSMPLDFNKDLRPHCPIFYRFVAFWLDPWRDLRLRPCNCEYQCGRELWEKINQTFGVSAADVPEGLHKRCRELHGSNKRKRAYGVELV